jgi:hypothetical protein
MIMPELEKISPNFASTSQSVLGEVRTKTRQALALGSVRKCVQVLPEEYEVALLSSSSHHPQ